MKVKVERSPILMRHDLIPAVVIAASRVLSRARVRIIPGPPGGRQGRFSLLIPRLVIPALLARSVVIIGDPPRGERPFEVRG